MNCYKIRLLANDQGQTNPKYVFAGNEYEACKKLFQSPSMIEYKGLNKERCDTWWYESSDIINGFIEVARYN